MKRHLPGAIAYPVEPSGWTGNEEMGYAKSIMDYLFRWMELRLLSGKQLALFVTAAPAGADIGRAPNQAPASVSKFLHDAHEVRDALLKMNLDIANLPRWSEVEIRARALQLETSQCPSGRLRRSELRGQNDNELSTTLCISSLEIIPG
jgi:hypothetical protein